MHTNDFVLFALAGLMLNITPGADMLYVATRSTTQGVRAGVISALGITAGCMVHILAAMVGLSAIIAHSATAFTVVKYLGAAYLFYLGFKSLFSQKNTFDIRQTAERKSLSRIFWQGVLTNVLNPKVALFFLAFLPQFIHTGSGSVPAQILFLGGWFNTSGFVVNAGVALLFGKMGNWLSGREWFIKWQHKVTGVILVSLGIKVALSTRK